MGRFFNLKLILKNVKKGRRWQTNPTAGEVNSGGKQEAKFSQDKVNELIQKRVNELNKRSEEKTK